jgi:hypothetical protein
VGLVHLPSIVYMHFISIFLISGCEHRGEDEEASLQKVSVEGVSHLRIVKAVKKIHLCDTCVPVLKDILHVAGPSVQQQCLVAAFARFPKHHKHHSAEKYLVRDMDRNSHGKNYGFCVLGRS